MEIYNTSSFLRALFVFNKFSVTWLNYFSVTLLAPQRRNLVPHFSHLRKMGQKASKHHKRLIPQNPELIDLTLDDDEKAATPTKRKAEVTSVLGQSSR